MSSAAKELYTGAAQFGLVEARIGAIVATVFSALVIAGGIALMVINPEPSDPPVTLRLTPSSPPRRQTTKQMEMVASGPSCGSWASS